MTMDYFHLPMERLGEGARIPLKVLGDSGEVFYEMALMMVRAIEENNRLGKPTVFICPVGPVGQYPIFVRLVKERRVSLKNCHFINMDEYLTEDGRYMDKSSPLSFRGHMERQVYSRIPPELVMPEENRIFPDPEDPQAVQRRIDALGGVDIAFGGIGINGHLAFNEPQEELTPEAFAALPTRVLEISRETRTANAIGDLGGALVAMPRRCVTIGMKEILSARRVVLGVFRDWHRAVVRQAAYGQISASFPVTLLQRHPQAMILVNANAARQPF